VPRAWVFGDDLDTDQIVPGRYAPFMVGQDKFHTYAFCDARPGFAREVRTGDILVGGENFGCGSSREYAVAALEARHRRHRSEEFRAHLLPQLHQPRHPRPRIRGCGRAHQGW
jgi:hypothetical protein